MMGRKTKKNLAKLGIVAIAILVAVLAVAKTVVFSNDIEDSKSPFTIILDGGSTGSRLHVFEFARDGDGKEECIRRGSAKADVPLSSFGRRRSPASDESEERGSSLNPTSIAEHMLPLFDYAASVIPRKHHRSTGVKYAATAGMRLLGEDEQEAIYDALHRGLTESESFAFQSFRREDLATLDGELEGYFGAVAANYLHGIVDTQLKVEGETEHDGPIGALDMGGSSTQIVFLPGERDAPEQKDCDCDDEDCIGAGDGIEHINGDDFFATSYLSYGADQFRERLWSTLIDDRQSECSSQFYTIAYAMEQIKNLLWMGDAPDESRDSYDVCSTVPNPCANIGFNVEFEGFNLVGTGDTDECIRQTRRLIPHPASAHDDHAEMGNQVGGVRHPPVRGKFLAMSLYYFVLDSLRVFSKANDEAHKALNQSWPNPSIEELHNALDGLCSRNWHGDMSLEVGSHSFTREEVLPHRCLEAVYMVTLLKDGYGFHPESRDITFLFDVDGSEVEWTLGMALSMNAASARMEEQEEQQAEMNTTLESGSESIPHVPSHDAIIVTSPSFGDAAISLSSYVD